MRRTVYVHIKRVVADSDVRLDRNVLSEAVRENLATHVNQMPADRYGDSAAMAESVGDAVRHAAGGAKR